MSYSFIYVGFLDSCISLLLAETVTQLFSKVYCKCLARIYYQDEMRILHSRLRWQSKDWQTEWINLRYLPTSKLSFCYTDRQLYRLLLFRFKQWSTSLFIIFSSKYIIINWSPRRTYSDLSHELRYSFSFGCQKQKERLFTGLL